MVLAVVLILDELVVVLLLHENLCCCVLVALFHECFYLIEQLLGLQGLLLDVLVQDAKALLHQVGCLLFGGDLGALEGMADLG